MNPNDDIVKRKSSGLRFFLDGFPRTVCVFFMKIYSISLKRQLRQFAQLASERELQQQLTDLAAQMDAYRQRAMTARELRHILHKYVEGASRELIQRYREQPDDLSVRKALAKGILQRDELPRDLLAALEPDDES